MLQLESCRTRISCATSGCGRSQRDLLKAPYLHSTCCTAMCAYVYMCVHIYIYVFAYVHTKYLCKTRVLIPVHVYIYICVYKYICRGEASLLTRTHAHTHTQMDNYFPVDPTAESLRMLMIRTQTRREQYASTDGMYYNEIQLPVAGRTALKLETK